MFQESSRSTVWTKWKTSSPFFLLLESERTSASTGPSFLFLFILRMVKGWPVSTFMMCEAKLMKISHRLKLRPLLPTADSAFPP